MNITFDVFERPNVAFAIFEHSRMQSDRTGPARIRISAESGLATAFVAMTLIALGIMMGGTNYNLHSDSAALRFFPGYERPVRATKGDRLDTETLKGIAVLDKG